MIDRQQRRTRIIWSSKRPTFSLFGQFTLLKMGNKAKTQKIREYILEKVNHYPSRISKLIQDEFGLTKQGAYYHLSSLVKDHMCVSGKRRLTT